MTNLFNIKIVKIAAFAAIIVSMFFLSSCTVIEQVFQESAVEKYSITGYVYEDLDGEGTLDGLRGAAVTLGSKTEVTSISGYFSFRNLDGNAKVRISVEKDDYTFDPDYFYASSDNNFIEFIGVSLQESDDTDDENNDAGDEDNDTDETDDENGDANEPVDTEPEVYSVSGNVLTYDSQPLISVAIDYDINSVSQTIHTDNNGYFGIDDIEEGAQVVITPSKQGYNFDPASKTIVEFRDDIVFYAVPIVAYVDITGSVLDTSHTPLENIRIDISYNSSHASIYTDVMGEFIYENIDKDTIVTITPVDSEYNFIPGYIEGKASNGNFDFVAEQIQQYYTLSGSVITHNDGQGLSNVEIQYNSDYSSGSTTTNSNGDFTIENIKEGYSTQLTPNKNLYDFDPDQAQFSSENLSIVFTAFKIPQYYDIDGYVLETGTANPLNNIGVKIEYDSTSQIVYTNQSGYFYYDDIEDVHQAVITPQNDDYNFLPEQRTIDKNTFFPLEFEAEEIIVYYDIVGHVETEDHQSLSDVKIEYQSQEGMLGYTYTNSQGYFEILGMIEGYDVTLTPEKHTYLFEPEYKTISVDAGSIVFVASLDPAYFYDLTVSVIRDVGSAIPIKATLVVEYSDGQSEQVETDSEGYYEFYMIPINLTLEITPIHTSFEFLPKTAYIDDTTDFQQFRGVDVTSVYSIAGNVSGSNGTGIEGVRIQVNNSDGHELFVVYTDSNGDFLVEDINANIGVYVFAHKDGYHFEPSEIYVDEEAYIEFDSIE